VLVAGSRWSLLYGSLGHVPVGCSVQIGGEWTAHFNRRASGSNDVVIHQFAEIFDNEDVPSPDNFICSKHMSAVGDGEQYEYGEVETHAIDADTSDFSPHQFIAPATYAAPLNAAPAPAAYSAPATT